MDKVVEFFWENVDFQSGENVIGLSGNLGAGKTTFVKYLLKSLGVSQNVISPTFVLRRDYELPRTGLTPSPSPSERGGVQIGQSFLTADLKKNYDGLKIKALEMRKESTKAEDILWQILRSSNLGYKFRRQHIVSGFITDFICLPEKLIIEVDGKIHDSQKERDEERSNIFQHLGFRVLRFKNEQVKESLNFVMDEILKALSPLSEGEGLGVRPLSQVRQIIHIDAYRLETRSQIYQVIGTEELADKNNLILIEWPELSENIFQKIFLFEHISETERKISVKVL